MFDLTQRVSIVTGANKGIGKDLALLMAKAGSDVVLIARSAEELERAAAEIVSKTGKRVMAIPYDLTNVEGIPDMIDSVVEEFGKIDILINNAGINIPKPAFEVSVEDWDRVMDLNLRSLFFCTQAVGRHMMAQEKGKIINMSSQMAHVGYYKRSAYCASKGGVLQLTKALAIEWAQYNINVNCIAPTFIETPMTVPMFKDKDFLDEVLNRIPLGRLGKTEDLYGAVLYLSSGASDFVTGQSIIVDGGWTVW